MDEASDFIPHPPVVAQHLFFASGIGRRLDRSLMAKLSTCQWLHDHQNLLITGPTGVGTSYLTCAFARKDCREGCHTVYTRISRLFEDLNLAKGDGRYEQNSDFVCQD